MTLHDMVAQAASLHAGRKAVWFDECNGRPPTSYTYATVMKLAMELTAFLQKCCGPQGKCEIGLYCYPGINLPSWILGILQVPAAYCPIDPDAPPLLSTYFVKKSNLQYILVENDKIEQFRASHIGWFSHSSSTIEHIGLTLFQMSWSSTDINLQADSMKSKFEAFRVIGNSQLGKSVCPEHLELKTSEGGYKDVGQQCSIAYLLHTSGTTGTPKIVRVPHTCIVPNIQHLQSIFEITQDDVLFLASPLTFDPSVVELFVALTSGASILILPNAVKMMPVELSAALFVHHHVTVLQATPTLLRRFGADIIKSTVLSANSSLRVLALGGGEERICFLDDEMIVPQGTMRETGDFVRVQNAEMFFLGRKDNQIKRHGKRFNIESLQQAAEDLCQVESCAVTWYQQEKLILFVVPRGDLEERETLQELQKRLPTHGIPDELVQIKALPLTSHGDSGGISKDAVFLYGGGDSLKALRFCDEIETLVGRDVPGLLEVILSRSIEEVYKHILKALFPDEDRLINDDSVLKRKLRRNSGEEIRRKYAKLKSESCLRVAPGLISFVALSRGNHFFSINLTESFLQPNNPAQLGVESQQPSFLHAVSPSTAESHVQGHETDNRTLTVTNKASNTDCCSVQQIHAEHSHVTTAEVTLRTRWKSDTRKCVDASPLIIISAKDEVSASVFVGSHSHTMQAIDLDTGEVKWEKNLGDRIESSACASRCGNFIVVGCYDGLVYVLQSSDGETYWTFATEDTVKSSAVADPSSGLIYIGSHDQHVYALDIYEKVCAWKLHCEGGAVFSSPCLSSFPHRVYAATLGGLLLAVNPVCTVA
ncbi:hypothetical protein ASZ78_015064 [Callipepla squamata]|uniref:Uncharacterized protein n=1 Tax=Callipepla squamata TaxID=9009 RepID=A0A226MJ45_CALSU|nr:hypothetical protein ASZ78_015064 [Callipepla squamata]